MLHVIDNTTEGTIDRCLEHTNPGDRLRVSSLRCGQTPAGSFMGVTCVPSADSQDDFLDGTSLVLRAPTLDGGDDMIDGSYLIYISI